MRGRSGGGFCDFVFFTCEKKRWRRREGRKEGRKKGGVYMMGHDLLHISASLLRFTTTSSVWGGYPFLFSLFSLSSLFFS